MKFLGIKWRYRYCFLLKYLWLLPSKLSSKLCIERCRSRNSMYIFTLGALVFFYYSTCATYQYSKKTGNRKRLHHVILALVAVSFMKDGARFRTNDFRDKNWIVVISDGILSGVSCIECCFQEIQQHKKMITITIVFCLWEVSRFRVLSFEF